MEINLNDADNSQNFDNLIIQEFGKETVDKYKSYLSEDHRMRKCWTCWDFIPYKLYEEHLKHCQPEGTVTRISDSHYSLTYPNPMRVWKTNLYSHGTWGAGTAECNFKTILPITGSANSNFFRIYAVSLNVEHQLDCQDLKKLFNKGHVDLSWDDKNFYTGPISSILTQRNTIEDVDPRRLLTVAGHPLEIDTTSVIWTNLSGITPRKPINLTTIFYGIKLTPI